MFFTEGINKAFGECPNDKRIADPLAAVVHIANSDQIGTVDFRNQDIPEISSQFL